MTVKFKKEGQFWFPIYDGWHCKRCEQIVMLPRLLRASERSKNPIEVMPKHDLHCPFRDSEDLDVFRTDFYSRKRPFKDFASTVLTKPEVPKRKPPKSEHSPRLRHITG
jgi:hypothetical protein